VKGSLYRRALLPLIVGLLVALALGVVWYGKQPRGEGAPAEGRTPDPTRVEVVPTPPMDRPLGPPAAPGPMVPGPGRGRAFGFYMGGPSPEQQLQNECTDRVRRLSGALLMYAMDYDERLPLAGAWCDGMYRYVQLNSYFRCPALKSGSGYAYNANLDQARVSDVSIPARVVGLFESSAKARNAADAGQSLCKPPRHPAGNSLGFLDGHAVTTPIADRVRLSWR